MKNTRQQWTAETVKINGGKTLKRGCVVSDYDGTHGVVVRIRPPEGPESVENHGTIWVWLDTVMEYGADNCEHYAFSNWNTCLRIEEEP